MKVDRSISLAMVLACAGIASGARAYSTPDVFIEAPTEGGGGGRWFSGSPADGYSCSVCHSSVEGQREFPLYVTGLPLEGYTVAQAREVVLSWPEFSQRWSELKPDPMAPLVPGVQLPAMSMVAELVAESGKASGIIEIRGGSATELEQCEVTRPNLKPRLGLRLYQVRPGVKTFQVKPDPNGTLRCEARHLGQRCIIALSSCGARQARFVWTPPMTQEGAIWFSAGLVTSEQLSGTPEGDSVYEVSVPMVQAGGGSGRYQETLRGTCAVANAHASRGIEHAWAMALVLLGLSARIARRRVVRARCASQAASLMRALVIAALALCVCGSCAEHEPVSQSSYPSSGLYTPGSTLGASDPTDTPTEGAGLSDRCVPLPAAPGAVDGGVVGTAGTLKVEYMTRTYDGLYAPKNCTAVWIETMGGAYVATLELYAAIRRPSLVYYQDHGCIEKLGPDVVASATQRTHDKMHMLEWSGVDFEGKGVPDGPYQLFIETTETDLEPGDLQVFDVTKGPAPYVMPLPVSVDGTLVQVTATWAVR